MTHADLQRLALELSPGERRELVDALWESLERDPEPLPEWQRRLLDQRLAALDEAGDPGRRWEEVEREIWGR